MDRLKELRIDRSEKKPGRSGKSSGGFMLGVLAALLVGLAVASLWWYARSGTAVEVTTAAVERTAAAAPSETVLDASGYVTARRRATVSSKITGKIVEVLVEEGMAIAEGQLLARLDDATQSRQLALAEAELATAGSSLAETEVRLKEAALALERTRRLVASEVSSQADLDADQAAYDSLAARLELGREQIKVAERQLEVQRQALADTEIRAPFAGVAVTKNAQPGEMISPLTSGGFTRTGICTLVDMSSLEIEVDVNEAYINRVQPGQPVRAVLDAYPDWQIPASVIISVPTADRQRATVRVRIAFDRAATGSRQTGELDPRILPDMGVKVSFLTDDAEVVTESSRPRVFIPAAALRRDSGEDVVFVVRDAGERNSTVERRALTIGEASGERVEVEDGLRGGEQVVVEASAELADGLRVRVR